MNKSEPTIREQWRALVSVSPGMTLLLVLSLAVAIGRAMYVIAIEHSDSFIRVIGLFDIWLAPWGLAFISGVFLAAHSPAIDRKAKALSSKRLRDAFGAKY